MLYNENTMNDVIRELKETNDVRKQILILDDTLAPNEIVSLVNVYTDGVVYIAQVDAALHVIDGTDTTANTDYLTIAYDLATLDPLTRGNMHHVYL